MSNGPSDTGGDRLNHLTLVAGTGTILLLGALVVHLFTGFPLRVLVPGAAALTVLMATAGWRAVSMVADGLAHMLTASGGLDRQREYSEQETLVVRGAYREAADSYRSHLVAFPDDHEARLRLADLTRRHLVDPAAAEALYLEVRRGAPTRAQAMAVANGLIDLHQATGDRERLVAELGRLERAFVNTAAGAAAGRRRRELLDEGRGGRRRG